MAIKSLLVTLAACLLLAPAMAGKEKPLPAQRPPSRPPTIQRSMKFQKKHGVHAKAKHQKFRMQVPKAK